MNNLCSFCEREKEKLFPVCFKKDFPKSEGVFFSTTICIDCFSILTDLSGMNPEKSFLLLIESLICGLREMRSSNPCLFAKAKNYLIAKHDQIHAMQDSINAILEEGKEKSS